MQLGELPPKKQKYIAARAEGKSKRQAALSAGYSEHMANSAVLNIETPDVRKAFAEIMRRKVPAEKIAQRVAEGLDAIETKFFQQDGKVTDQRDVISWSERRQYASLAAEYGGYFSPQVEISGVVLHVLSPSEKREAAAAVQRLLTYDSDSENPIEGEHA
jgi:hypothetical protein